jgi:hypothetical protein
MQTRQRFVCEDTDSGFDKIFALVYFFQLNLSMKTFHKVCITFVMALYALSVFARNDTAKINFIKVQFAEINNNLYSYKKVVKTDTAETTEGNEILLFFSGSEIKKIRATYYGETGKNISEYYFFNKKLIFYYLTEYNYKVPINVNPSGKIASTKEKRYYFYDGKIFLIKLNPKEAISQSEFEKFKIETQKESNRLLHLK